MSLLVICEILGQVINTFTADNKYSLRNQYKYNYLRNKKFTPPFCIFSEICYII